MRIGLILLISVVFPLSARAETITLGAYNIENFRTHFTAHKMRQANPNPSPEVQENIAEERRQNDEDNWEAARVILEAGFNPDILVIEEGCAQSDLEYFNREWLKGAYETVIVFQTNTDRDQTLGMMLKPGFKVIERKDQYYLEADSVPNPRGERLFARGPAFCLIQAPSGYKFWMGVTHMKSKSGNSVEVTKWRKREAVRSHQIMLELAKSGTSDVILMGDMNDEWGIQEFEAEAGGDAIADLVGPSGDGFVLLTKPLADAGEASFGGYWVDRYRTLIDHAVATPTMKNQVKEVKVIRTDLASVASDHFPLMVKIEADSN